MSKFTYYNNGIKTIKVKDGEEPPKDFVKGCLFNKGKKPWNKGLTAQTDEKVKQNAEAAHKTMRRNGGYEHVWNKGLTKETDERVLKNYESTKKAIKEKYGVDNISQYLCKQSDYEIWNKGLSSETDDRMRKASENHKGCIAWNKGLTSETDGRVKNYSDKWKTGEPQKKRYKTQKDNETLGKNKNTKSEIELLEKLNTLYGEENIIQQYMSENYPLKADFYIKPYDVYIELNAYFTHMKHPFSGTEKDLKILGEVKEKYKTFYDNAKYVWTDLDVRKWKTAVENNLNFIVIYPYGDEDIVYAHWKQCEDNKFVLEQINELF